MKTRSNVILEDERLLAYADGELDGNARVEMEQALAQNPEARQRLEAFRGSLKLLSTGLSDAPTAVIPPSGAIRRRGGAIAFRRRAGQVLAVAAAACLVLTGIWAGLTAPEAPPPSKPQVSVEDQMAALRACIDQLEARLAALTAAAATPVLLDAALAPVRTQGESTAAVMLTAAQHREGLLGDSAKTMDRYHEIVKAWPKTDAARTARARIAELSI